ncbi:MAG: ELWxxDGT repeat protein, partial [Chloroflexaceae bacterium]
MRLTIPSITRPRGLPYRPLTLLILLALCLTLTPLPAPPLRAAPLSGEPAMVKDLRAGAGGSAPEMLTVIGQHFFFVADDGTHGRELWISDGTEAGTALLKDIWPGAGGFGLPTEPWLTVVGDRLYFVAINTNGHGVFAHNVLWISDGTEQGTRPVNDAPSAYPTDPSHLKAYNGRVFFFGVDPPHGEELWTSDGTAQGTFLVKDVMPGNVWSYPSQLTVANNRLFFAAYRSEHHIEPWISDGTEEGTRLVRDIHPDSHSWPGGLIAFRERLAFFASDGVHGKELWISDGTAEGTFLVRDMRAGPDDFVGLWDPAISIAVAGDALFFVGDDGVHGHELWTSDGTAAGTRLVRDLRVGAPGAMPRNLTPAHGRLFFSADDGAHGAELWISDGTEAGTAMVGDIRPGAAGAEPAAMIAFNGQLFFRADDGVHGAELWRLPLVRYTSTPAPGAMLDLGSTTVGQPAHALLQAAMEGIGALPLSISLAGEHPGAFSVTPAGPVLNEDQPAATLTISCNPGTAGEQRAILWINFPAPGSPARYDLRCTGVAAPAPTATPPPAPSAPAPTATPPPAPATRPQVFIPLVRQDATRR